MKKLICLTLVFVLIAGCAGTQDKHRTIGEGTAAGACLGGILGAALGYASGDNEEQRKERAKKWGAIGAGLGGLAGAAFGYHVSEIKAQYIKKEDDLNTRIAKVRRMNNETQKFNTFLWGEIRELDQKIDKMAAQYNSRKLKKSKLVNKKKEVQAKHKEANEILMGLKNQVKSQRMTLAREKSKRPAGAVKLDFEIDKLERTVAELELQTLALARINNRIRL